MGDHFGDSDHNSIYFKAVVEKERDGSVTKFINWGKTSFINIPDKGKLGTYTFGKVYICTVESIQRRNSKSSRSTSSCKGKSQG